TDHNPGCEQRQLYSLAEISAGGDGGAQRRQGGVARAGDIEDGARRAAEVAHRPATLGQRHALGRARHHDGASLAAGQRRRERRLHLVVRADRHVDRERQLARVRLHKRRRAVLGEAASLWIDDQRRPGGSRGLPGGGQHLRGRRALGVVREQDRARRFGGGGDRLDQRLLAAALQRLAALGVDPQELLTGGDEAGLHGGGP